MLALALVILAAGCPRDDRLYSGDPTWPREVVVPQGLYVAFTGAISESDRSPLEVTSLSPRCEPAGVCASSALESRVLVFGAGFGEGAVTINYTHPITGISRDHRIPLRVIPATSTGPLRVGDALPDAETPVSLTVDDVGYRCLPSPPSSPGERNHYDCAPDVEVAGGRYAFGGSDRPLKNQVRACVVSRAGTVTGIVLLSSPPHVLGDPNDRCAVPGTP